jgi:hypothetical protein
VDQIRPIDANAFKKELLIAADYLDEDTMLTVLNILDCTTTIDPESLRPKGQWKPYFENVEIYNAGGFTERKQIGWICGRCRSKESFTQYYKTHYCPSCGAKMEVG